jgi:hypothetical protein
MIILCYSRDQGNCDIARHGLCVEARTSTDIGKMCALVHEAELGTVPLSSYFTVTLVSTVLQRLLTT